VVVRRIKRTRRGFDVRLPEREREVLRALPDQMRALLDDADPEDLAVRRLFPSAYLDDEAASADFDGVVRGDLERQRREALDTLARTVDEPAVAEDDLLSWLSVVNDVRLVIGVRLAVTEGSTAADFAGDEEASSSYALYAYLTYLEEEIVEALAGR
jgi:hypothetical protein